MFVVLVEHAVLFMKLVIQNFIDDVPEKVQRGELEKNSLIQNFKENVDEEEKCRIWR